MKNYLFLLLLITSQSLFCQQKTIQKRNITTQELEINTLGLDDVVILNSENNRLEVELFDENPHAHNIVFKEENGVLTLKFNIQFAAQHTNVFRKYITTRLQRAKAYIKIPKNISVVIHGSTVGVSSNSYKGNLFINIKRGNVQLHNINGNTEVRLFQGNVFATTHKTNLKLTTTKGDILVGNDKKTSPFQEKNLTNTSSLQVNSINANITVSKE